MLVTLFHVTAALCAELGWARIASSGWDGGHDVADLLEQMRVAQREGRAAVQHIVENSTTASGTHSYTDIVSNPHCCRNGVAVRRVLESGCNVRAARRGIALL